MASYCQELKVLADQLSNVDAPISDQDLVLQTLAGLTESYESIALVLQNIKPLPSFTEVRSQLCMNETRKANHALHASSTAATALHTQTHSNQNSTTNPPNNSSPTIYSPNHSYSSDRNRGRGSPRGRGRGRSSWGRGRGFNQNQQPYFPNQLWTFGNSPWAAQSSNPSWTHGPMPPCPYPTTNQSTGTNPGTGLLGPRPNQSAHMAYTPTNIEQAMYTMSLNQPDWNTLLDTGASGHMQLPLGSQDPDHYPSMQQHR